MSWACLASNNTRQGNASAEALLHCTYKCQFQVLEITVERTLQNVYMGTETSQDQKSQVDNYGLQSEFVVFSQWSGKHPGPLLLDKVALLASGNYMLNHVGTRL